ncbi:MAG: tetratricopeptide repeat protein, partial [Gemmatimonadetes bacterium]|nr:tetratricopeptide repeat protein [Gemmatimonadota bacterium]NIQ58098.1 tetratricopeptide repeat protein [Gemmatimonadota bacterium]NIU78300.1 tetratricopeptide repeat protein [Gammaproteobacteria bacterium]NIX47254.1 tetratricopeptide repeat protein [Gemmatimonadota bacterium]NIY11631.1 tetratricopeptide repeat protein [Gemmatimonadota bacterium]
MVGLAAQAPADTVPLYDDLGDHHYAITTAVPAAQAYFDQGLRLYYAFNHQEAIRSFREARRLDPGCAMCAWGEALAFGPNINLPMDSAAGVAAYEAVQAALRVQGDETERERRLIASLAIRYAANPPADRASLDSAYARAMAELARDYPDDPEIAVLYGESLMDLRPWDYWTEAGEPQPGMEEALASFEKVTEASPEHPGACHFFIHAVEAVYPDRAVDCAERLATLMPGAGHLVHMPGHIYIRVGRYADAIRANEHAVHADETYIRDQNPGFGMYTAGYYPHNYDFMAFGAAMAGRSGMALEAAEKVAELVPEELIREPGMSFLQHWMTRHLQMRVRFARWDGILATPAPAGDLLHARAMHHYARGRALAGKGDAEAASAELARLRELAADPSLDGLRLEFNASDAILAVAESVLAGAIATARGDHDEAAARLREAVDREDDLLYGEPPEWTIPARQELGRALLAAGRPAEAEAVYRGDLERFRENGWSLHGLAESLRRQGREVEADEVAARFAAAWREADVDV